MSDALSLIFNNAISLIIVIPLMGGFLSGLSSKFNKRLVYPIALLSVLASSFFVLLLAQQVYSHGIVARALESDDPSKLAIPLPSGRFIPVRIVLVADSMGVLMALVASLVSILALIYS